VTRRPGVYLVLDPDACRGADPVSVARAALRGGAARLQLRSKRLGDGAQLQLAQALAGLCRDTGVPFVVNDRPDLALLVKADEIHVGQDDLPLGAVRSLVGTMSIGRSTHDLAQVERARLEGADRIAFGPVFPTSSKDLPDPVVGLEQLARAITVARRPVIAIGGIDAPRCAALRGLGLAEVAVISAICAAEDPERATRALVEALA